MGPQRRQRRPSARNAQLARILHILRDLDRLGGVDLYELAERHGTAVRTIRRDFAALEEVGIPLIEEQDGKRKRWRVAFKQHLEKLSTLLDASHYLALRVAMEHGGALHRTSPMFATLEDLAEKIEEVLGSAGKKELAAIEACFHSYEKFVYKKSAPDVLWPLVRAISERRLCRVTYRAPGRARESVFEILPLRIFTHQGAVYLMCRVPKHDDVATLNLQRLEALRVLERRGSPPKDFDPEKLENASFGVYGGGEPTRYVLRFAKTVAPYIRERVWHPSQRLRERRHGGVELEFTCGASFEVTAWVASWQSGVEAIEPAWLRKELAQLAEWLSGTYAQEPPMATGRASLSSRRRRSSTKRSARRLR